MLQVGAIGIEEVYKLDQRTRALCSSPDPRESPYSITQFVSINQYTVAPDSRRAEPPVSTGKGEGANSPQFPTNRVLKAS
jgi:hypothetical protein